MHSCLRYTSIALNAHKDTPTIDEWVVDSGASDHMTGSPRQFTSYSPCSGNQKVRIANGSLSSVAGKGTIMLSKKIQLCDVLHVTNLAFNLLSVHKITKTLKCETRLSSVSLVFFRITLERWLGLRWSMTGCTSSSRTLLIMSKLIHQPVQLFQILLVKSCYGIVD